MSTTLTSKAKAGLLSQRTRFNHWLINDGNLFYASRSPTSHNLYLIPLPLLPYPSLGKRKLALGMWILLMVIIYIIGVIYYGFSDNYTDVRALFGSTLLISRAATLNLHLISAVILLPVCRTLISALRQTPLNRIIPLDDNLVLHRWMGWSILIFAVIHTMGHAFNFRNLTIKDPDGTGASWGTRYFLSGPGWTGWTMLCLLLVIAITALDRFKKVNFERFWYTHHLVFLFILLFSFHGSWCFIPKDREPKCSEAGTFWRYWVVSGFIYTLERIAREWRSARSTKIIKVIQHPSDVVEVQFNKDPGIQVKAGQYIFLCCPTISLCQWHPFTLTSAPEEDYLSVHIRCVGDFTRAFARQLGCEISVGSRKISEKEKTLSSGKEPSTQYLLLPQVQLDGPFGSASEDVFKYEVAMMFGAGIGVTPFASVLKSVWYRLNRPERSCRLYKLYFYWTCRDYKVRGYMKDGRQAEMQGREDHLRSPLFIITNSPPPHYPTLTFPFLCMVGI